MEQVIYYTLMTDKEKFATDGEVKQVSIYFDSVEQATTSKPDITSAIWDAIKTVEQTSYTGDWSLMLSEYVRREDGLLDWQKDTVFFDSSDHKVRQEIAESSVLVSQYLEPYDKYSDHYDSAKVATIIATEVKEHVWLTECLASIIPDYWENNSRPEELMFMANELAKEHQWKKTLS